MCFLGQQHNVCPIIIFASKCSKYAIRDNTVPSLTVQIGFDCIQNGVTNVMLNGEDPGNEFGVEARACERNCEIINGKARAVSFSTQQASDICAWLLYQ